MATLRERRKRERRKKRLKILLLVVGIAIVIGVGVYAGFHGMREAGRRHLQEAAGTGEDAGGAEGEGDGESSGPSEIIYNGSKYRYKDGMFNILCMGVDIRQRDLEELGAIEGTEADSFDINTWDGRNGQADAILVVAIDTKEHTLDVIAVPRDTMVPIDIYALDGSFVGTETQQITLQYAYGDGREQSCELMEAAVSDLMYQLPINGYAAIWMLALPILNDAIGGVEVTIEEDLTLLNPEFVAGTTLTLHGEEAIDYACKRDITVSYSSMARVGRQKQYLMAFARDAKAAVKKNPSLAIDIYKTVSEYMVTDIGLDEAAYLATEVMQSDFGEDSLHIVDVELTQGEIYEEYYAKEDELQQLILDVFYEKVADGVDSEGQSIPVIERMLQGAYQALEPPQEPEGDDGQAGEEETGEVVYANSDVNIRKEPSTDSEKLGTARAGARLIRTQELDIGWSEIEYLDGVAYIRSDLLTTEEPPPEE